MAPITPVTHAATLRRVATQFISSASLSYLLAPLVGFGVALLYSIPNDHPQTMWVGFAVTLCAATLTTLAVLSFRHLLNPVLAWAGKHPGLFVLPEKLYQRVRRFTLLFWSLHLSYVVLAPMIYQGFGMLSADVAPTSALVTNFFLLQAAASLALALPSYLAGLNSLGKLVGHIGLDRVHVSLRYTLFTQVGILPLLVGVILVQFYWWQTGRAAMEAVWVWAGLAVLTLSTAWVAVRGLGQALKPVQELLAAGTHVSHEDFGRLRPQSIDEIGYMTQMLAGLFSRLGDQDAQVRAIVDNAAEGIIVVDETGRISMFNRAAESLFGYQTHEVRSRPLAWLLPSAVDRQGVPMTLPGEQELEGIHNCGRKIAMSVRMSEMMLSGRRMYVFLVADISERKAAEQKLMEAESRYRHLVETAHDLVWSVDLQARWTYLNRAAKAIYGREPSEMLHRPVRDFQVDEYADQDFSAFKEILKGKELVQYETAHLDANGSVHYLSFNAKAIRDAKGDIVGISGTARDITEQKAFERQLAYQAQHDTLTGLANRRQFQEELERLVARVARSGSTCALCYIDLDQFKYINDTLGHPAGDRLLIEFSRLLKTHLRESDMLARFGGDEFTVLVYNVDAENALRVAENVRLKVESYRFLERGQAYSISCSIGVAMIDEETQTVDECMAHADLACHLAKTQGRNRCYIYQPFDENKLGMQADIGWAARVKETLENNRMQLVFQPIAALSDGQVGDYEVLARMVCDDGQIILPGGFMPAAERFGLATAVDRWMVDQSITQLAELHARGEHVRFSINLSAPALEDQSLLELIKRRLDETELPPHALTFEITETAAIGNLTSAIDFINALKAIGCLFALDDFGSGFSSFAYLKHLPVDKLKIDGGYVQNLVGSTVDQAMVQSMNQIAHALGKVTIAEFVENQETYALLQELGVDFAQGYYVGKPRKSVIETPRPGPRLVHSRTMLQ